MNDITKQILLDVNINTDKLKEEAMQMSTELDKLLARQKELVSSGQKNSKAYQDIAAQVRVAKDAIKENTAQIGSNTSTGASLTQSTTHRVTCAPLCKT